MGSNERWVGVNEVAVHLGVAKDSIYRWVETKSLPARRVGRLAPVQALRSMDRDSAGQPRRSDHQAAAGAAQAGTAQGPDRAGVIGGFYETI